MGILKDFFGFIEDDEDDIEEVTQVTSRRKVEKVSKPAIFDQEAAKKAKLAKEKQKQPEVAKAPEEKVEVKIPKKDKPTGYRPRKVISPFNGATTSTPTPPKKSITANIHKKPARKNNGLITVLSPFHGDYNDEIIDEASEAILTDKEDIVEEKPKKKKKRKERKKEKAEDKKIPTVEENIRNIANIVNEEQNELKIIEERTGEFKLDLQKTDENGDSLIDEINDDMSLDELMSLYEKKFKD